MMRATTERLMVLQMHIFGLTPLPRSLFRSGQTHLTGAPSTIMVLLVYVSAALTPFPRPCCRGRPHRPNAHLGLVAAAAVRQWEGSNQGPATAWRRGYRGRVTRRMRCLALPTLHAIRGRDVGDLVFSIFPALARSRCARRFVLTRPALVLFSRARSARAPHCMGGPYRRSSPSSATHRLSPCTAYNTAHHLKQTPCLAIAIGT
jgi:hypothetical protein